MPALSPSLVRLSLAASLAAVSGCQDDWRPPASTTGAEVALGPVERVEADGGGASADEALARAVRSRRPFVPVFRQAHEAQLGRARALGMPEAMMSAAVQPFLLAVHKDALAERWFFSSYLKQHLQGSTLDATRTPRSLATKVVELRVGTGKLHLVDAEERKEASDHAAREAAIDAFPIVTRYAAFEGLPGAEDYILVDPGAGLAQINVESAGGLVRGTTFKLELALAQRPRVIEDGFAFDRLVTGQLTVDATTETRLFLALGIALRRYAEGEGFVPMALPPGPERYARATERLNRNQGTREILVRKWNIHPGMRPIRWLVSDLEGLQQEPRFAGTDLFGAVKRGIESWNEAFGFPVLVAEKAGPDDSFGDDDKNFFIIEKNPRVSSAVANARVNPNTGEVRGGSVHYYSGWIEAAFRAAGGRQPVPQPAAQPPAPTPAATLGELVVNGLHGDPLCTLTGEADQDLATEPAPPTPPALDPAAFASHVAHVVAHEIGHVLGLRHNFKGSLVSPPSSVMDYLTTAESIAAPLPGPYDVAALRRLYGLGAAEPPQPFCSDELVGVDPLCGKRDRGTDPLRAHHVPQHLAALDRYLSGTGGPMSFVDDQSSALYLVVNVAFGKTSADRSEAFRALLGPGRAPQQKPLAGVEDLRLTAYLRVLFDVLFPAPPSPPPSLSTPFVPGVPMVDRALLAEVADQLQQIALDAARSFELRRLAVGALKRVQSAEAHEALRRVHAALAAARGATPTVEAPALDDLVVRVERALAPYYDR